MFDPTWDEGCKSCSFWIDNLDGVSVRTTTGRSRKRRDEAGLSYSMEWLERHNAYEPAPVVIAKGLSKRS